MRNLARTSVCRALLLGLGLLLAGCGGGGRQEAPAESKESAEAAADAAPAAAANEQGFQEITSSDIRFQWKVDGSNLQVVVRAPTQGWVGVGFDPTNLMKDANFIIGYVADGQASFSDQFGTQLTAHASDESLGGQVNVGAPSGTEADGATELSFTIPLDSGDQYDRVLAAGQSYDVLLAYGPNDDFEMIHQVRVEVQMQL